MRTIIASVSVAGMAIVCLAILWSLSHREQPVGYVIYNGEPIIPVAGPGPQYDAPLTQPDHWLALATADGGTPGIILDESDGGVHVDVYKNFVITNDNGTCVNCGSDGSGDADPVNVTTGFELGTGAGCVNGASVAVDGKPTNWACTSQGAAVNVRVTVTK